MASPDQLAQCITLINQAKLSNKEEKQRCLLEVQEIALGQHPQLIPELLAPICEFQADPHPDVRKFVADFLRAAAKQLPEALPQALPVLQYLINDSSTSVVKRVLLAATDLFRRTLHWVCSSTAPAHAGTWQAMMEVKAAGFRMLDGENDSVRTHVIKFCDAVILGLSYTSNPKPNESSQGCLSNIPAAHPVLNPAVLEAEGQAAVTDMAARLANGDRLSKTSLPLLLNVLHGVIKQRPATVHTILPAMIVAAKNAAKSSQQDKSLSENFKRVFISLSGLEVASPWLADLGQRLYHLGAKKEAQDLMKRGKKRRAEQPPEAVPAAVRARPEGVSRVDPRARGAAPERKEGGEEWPEELKLLLLEDQRARAWDPATVANIVLANFSKLPAAPAGVAPPLSEQIAAAIVPLSELYQKIASAQEVGTVMTVAVPESKEEVQDVEMEPPPQEMAVVPAEATPAPERDPGSYALSRFLSSAPKAAELMRRTCGERAGRAVLMLSNVLAAKLGGLFEPLNPHMMERVLSLGDKGELALHCLHREFAIEQCHGLPRYSVTFNKVLEYCCEQFEAAEDEPSRAAATTWLQNLLLHAPSLEFAVLLPKMQRLCLQAGGAGESHAGPLLQLVHRVMIARPASCEQLLQFCLELCTHQHSLLRGTAVEFVCEHLFVASKGQVQEFASEQLKSLLSVEPAAPAEGEGTAGEGGKHGEHLDLFCALCVLDNTLLREAVLLCPQLAPEVQTSLSQAIGAAMERVDPSSPDVAELIQDFAVLFPDPDKPPPLELAVLMLQKLTRSHKAAPVPQPLLDAVLELHSSCDIPRLMATVFPFLPKDDALYQLPVILCLPEEEMQASLTELIERKEVTPADLLVQLHHINPESEETALVQLGEPTLRLRKIKEATSYCFAESSVFTSEVFAAVIQRLVDQAPLPKLFMRTVIQAIRHFDKLSGFVIEILRSLVTKEIWKDDSQWKGFVRCCEYLGGKCIPVLLQLPLPQFKALWQGQLLPEELKAELAGFVSSAAGSNTPQGYQEIVMSKQ